MTDTLDFTAKDIDTNVYGINEYLGVSKDIDIDTGTPKAIVDYELQPEMRSWGIKSIYIFIKRVRLEIYWECYPDELTPEDKDLLTKAGGIEMRNGKFEGFINIDTDLILKEPAKDWHLESELEFDTDGSFQIDDVTIDLETQIVTVS